MNGFTKLINKGFSTLGLFALIACVVAVPSAASACGAYYMDMGCGVIEGIGTVNSDDGAVELQFRGAFAWTIGADYNGFTEETEISKPIMGFFRTRCETDDPNYEYCRQAVSELIAGVNSRKPVSFWIYGGASSEKPFFIHQGSDEPTPVSFWDLPFPVETMEESPACGTAFRLIKSMRVQNNQDVSDLPHVPKQSGSGFVEDTASVHPQIGLTEFPLHLELEADEIEIDSEELLSSESALLEEPTHALEANERMTGCSAVGSGSLGLGGGFFAWVLALSGLVWMRRSFLTC